MATLQVPKTFYSKLLASCGIAALLISAVAVASFYGYRHNRLGNSLSVDISNTAQRISPLVDRSLRNGRPREARRLLGIFAGLIPIMRFDQQLLTQGIANGLQDVFGDITAIGQDKIIFNQQAGKIVKPVKFHYTRPYVNKQAARLWLIKTFLK